MIEAFRYQTEEGKEPLTEWLLSLRDKQAQAKIRVRIKRIEAGNFGDCDPVGEGVHECCAEVPKNRNLLTSRPPRNIGKIGKGGKNEQET